MDPFTKTWAALGLVVLALLEFWSAMTVFGIKGEKPSHVRAILRLHRIAGYVYLVWFVWISWICVDMMERLFAAGNYVFDARNFGHGALAVTLFLLLGLKLTFIRRYRAYRPYVPLLGIILVVGTLLLWAIAGWMFLIIMGGKAAVS